jgi:hypothetical protein
MSERSFKEPIPADNKYFQTFFGNFLRQAEKVGISPDRLEGIAELVRDLPDEELTGQAPIMVAKKEGLTDQEKAFFSSLIRAGQEINEAEGKGELTSEEAEKWREVFGLNEGGRILMTTEELREEQRERLAQIEKELATAKGKRRDELMRQKAGIKAVVKAIEAKPTTPGGGTTGQATKRMARGGSPE